MTYRNRLIARILLALALGFMLAFSYGSLTRADAGIDGGTNAYRNSQGLGSIATSNLLTSLAAQRAQQIYSPNTGANFFHDFWWWDDSGCRGIGENLVYRLPADSDPSGYAVQAWIDSASHRANLLGDWDVTGSAIYFAPDGGEYAAQLFGKDCGLDALPEQPLPQQPVPAPSIPVNDPPVGQAPQPAVVQPSTQLPNTSMETP